MWKLTRFLPLVKDGKQCYTSKTYATYKAARQQAGKHEKNMVDYPALDAPFNELWKIKQIKGDKRVIP